MFQFLRGVTEVEQGHVAAIAPNDALSEAVIVHYLPSVMPLEVLIEVHLRTHSSRAQHRMRWKYRSAIYSFDSEQHDLANQILHGLQGKFCETLVTQVLPFAEFVASPSSMQNYYAQDASRPFCQNFIEPKLALLRQQFASHAVHCSV